MTRSSQIAAQTRLGRLALGRRLRRLPLVPTAPLAVLLTFAGLAICAPFVTPYNPVENDLINSLLPPAWMAGGSADHPLGTDSFGRDILSRLLFGARVSFVVAGTSLAIASTLGTTIGLVAGFRGGWVDTVLMRLVDALLSLPKILIALVLAVAVGPSMQNLILVLGFLTWCVIARLVRGETLALKRQDFVRYSAVIAVPRRSIVLRHILPNVLPTVLVASTLEVAHLILLEASLSFLGAGLPAPQASWGVMISEGRALVSTGWWIALFPGILITTTVLCANWCGDWMRDHFDPRMRRV